MRGPRFLLLLPFALGLGQDQDRDRAQKPGSGAQDVAKRMRDRLLELYTNEAESYTIHRDRDHREKLEFHREPVYVWTNPVRPTKQDGAVFVWTWKGRAEVLGSFFSFPGDNGKRNVWHELQSLSLAVLDVSRPRPHEWTPEAQGIDLTAIEGAHSAREAGRAAVAPDARAEA